MKTQLTGSHHLEARRMKGRADNCTSQPRHAIETLVKDETLRTHSRIYSLDDVFAIVVAGRTSLPSKRFILCKLYLKNWSNPAL